MEIKLLGRVLGVRFVNGVNYCTFNDAEVGGQIDLSIPGAEGAVKIDSLINVHAIIKPGKGKFGQYLKVDAILNDVPIVKEGGK